MSERFSVALTGTSHDGVSSHLTRDDGQEDVCFALWVPSTGATRFTSIMGDPVLPAPGETEVRGTVSLKGDYALRAVREASKQGAGIALLHSHPGASGWQSAREGSADFETERKIANLARAITGLPLVGLTLSTGSQTWSGRCWDRGSGATVSATDAESVRVLGPTLRVGYHPSIRPAPKVQATQSRTVHSWGDVVQSHLARLRVLVVGGGSVGQVVLEMLARTGVESVGVMDFDTVDLVNLDRLHGATRLDAFLRVSKTELGARVLRDAATASPFFPAVHEMSICEPEGLAVALDYDVIFCCVDRPWPRHVMNTIASADIIPVIDGGVRLEPGPVGLRNAYWRAHVAGAGRPCIRCLGQYDVADVQLERDGSLDDPAYIAGLPIDDPRRVRQNVFAISLAAASALTNQFLSLVVAPSGFGDPGPLRFDLRQHRSESDYSTCDERCSYQGQIGSGDARTDPTGAHAAAQAAIELRSSERRRTHLCLARAVVAGADGVRSRVEHLVARTARQTRAQ